MKYKFNYAYDNERIRFFLFNDVEGPIYTDEYIDFSKWGTEKLKYVNTIVEDKMNKLVNTCKLIVSDLEIDIHDKVNTKISAIEVITDKVKENDKHLENLIAKLDISIKDWYIKKYPDDELGKTLSSEASFLDLNNLLNSGKGKSVYTLLGGDSETIIRERCFQKLSELTNQSYDDIYNKWLLNDVKEIDYEKKQYHNEYEEEIEK